MDQPNPQPVAPLTKEELTTIANIIYNAPTQNLQAAQKLIDLLQRVQMLAQSVS